MHKTFIILISAITMISCKAKMPENNNPLLNQYTTPYEVPPFDQIKHEHYLPAIQEGIARQKSMIEQITGNNQAPDFNNTILAFDQSGDMLYNVSQLFFNISATDSDDSLQIIAREITPLLTRHWDDLSLNAKLFERIKTVYNKRNECNLDASQIRVVEKYYMDFIRNGANLSVAQQDSLRKLNEELSMLCLQFGENLLAETNKNFQLIVDKEADLTGLPDAQKEAAAKAANEADMAGKWLFTLQKPCLIPFLQYAANRSLREKIYKGYTSRGNIDNANNNKKITAKIVNLRAKRAALLGYNNHAAWVIEENMAQTPEKVISFLDNIWQPSLLKAQEELKQMQAIADREGEKIKLQSWDWWYYSEKLRKEKYDLDESEFTPYFSLENIRNGMFDVANKLYHITFERDTTIPVYHPQVEAWNVKEADGTHLGILFLDYHPRDGKHPGAWCTTFRDAGTRNGKEIHPLVSIVCNFTQPTKNAPALLTWEEVITIFHEFGHGLHFLFTKGEYKRTAGVVARDYVEMPSQIMENWAAEPLVIKQYGRHYKTGETIPDTLIAKLQKSTHFNQGFITTEYLAASYLDMKLHLINADNKINDINIFESDAMNSINLIPEILPRYRTTYFSHIFDGGYSAGYYVYIWAAVLDADAFYAFKQSGDIFNQELAVKFREHCLKNSGEEDGMELYRKFRGQDPTVDALLQKRGLIK